MNVLGLAFGDVRIGNPVTVDAASDNAAFADTPLNHQQPQKYPQQGQQQQQQHQQQRPQATSTQPVNTNTPIFPIKSLNPYQNKWTIKARILSKGDVKSWSNARGSGQLFSVVMSDASGSIKATGFKDAVQIFYELLQEGQVYQISKATLKPANKQYNSTDNDYEMTFDQNTSIVLCTDGDVPQIQYSSTPLSDLENLKPNDVTDVLGIVKEASALQELVSKSQKQLKKRELLVCDQSGYSVRLTLWGRQADNYNDGEPFPVIGVKGAKVSEFSGRSLSLGFDSCMQLNPDIAEAHRLRSWWDNDGGRDAVFQTYTSTGGGSGGGSNPVKTIEAVSEERLGVDAAAYFKLVATVSHIKQENCMYPACPTEGCAKKVNENNDNQSWRCEKCDQNFPAPNYRYILSYSVSDYTGQMWIQSFNDQGTKLLGMSASDLYNLKTSSTGEYEAVFSKALGQLVEFKVRAKAEMYQDEVKVRCAALELERIDYTKSGMGLVGLIDSWKSGVVV